MENYSFPIYIDPSEACRILSSLEVGQEVEEIQLRDGLDRILAEDIYSVLPLPPFDKSPFDGFSFRATDTPGTLRVVRTIAAGDICGSPLDCGEAVRIFTGAPIPPGADAVIKQENASYKNGFLEIPKSIQSGVNVIKKGEVTSPGSLLLREGKRLTPANLGTIASQGINMISVYKKPVVSVLSTGTELIHPNAPLAPGKIYESSSYTIISYLQHLGFITQDAGIEKDDINNIINKVQSCFENSDLVITTGGASCGDFDFARTTAEQLNLKTLFWKLNMKPGGAMLASYRKKKTLLALSGNPAASVIQLLTVAMPYLKKMCGITEFDNQYIFLPLKEDLPLICSVTRMLRGHLEWDGISAVFAENEGRSNLNLSSFDNCNIIGIIPPTKKKIPAGTINRAIRLSPELN